jgi:translation initiation factor 3 subunit L
MKATVWSTGSLASGDVQSASDVDFTIDGDMVHITDTKVQRRYSDFFIRHTERLQNLVRTTSD